MAAKQEYWRGVRAGLPIGLGYVPVSFSFGIMAVAAGFSWWQAAVISVVTVTSAGQLAGIGVMVHPGQYIQMLLSQLTINVRYSFMALALAQKVEKQFCGLWRWLLGFMITDEVFAIASLQRTVTVAYFAGLVTLPYIGWALGTLCGALLGGVLPHMVMDALCIAIYGMFVAIVLPPAKKEKPIIVVTGAAIALSCLFYYVPALQALGGLSVCICAAAAAVLGALLFPVKEEP